MGSKSFASRRTWKSTQKVKKSIICEFLLKLKINDCRTNIYQTGFCPFQNCTKKENFLRILKIQCCCASLKVFIQNCSQIHAWKMTSIDLIWKDCKRSSPPLSPFNLEDDRSLFFWTSNEQFYFLTISWKWKHFLQKVYIIILKLYHQFNIGMLEIIAFFLCWFIFLILRWRMLSFRIIWGSKVWKVFNGPSHLLLQSSTIIGGSH